MHDDHDRPGSRRAGASRDEQRRWGYDPDEDLHARGIAQDERQFGGDRGWGGYGGERRADADDPRAPRGRHPVHPDARPAPRRPEAETGRPHDHRDGGEDRAYARGFEPGRQGEWLGHGADDGRDAPRGGPDVPRGEGRSARRDDRSGGDPRDPMRHDDPRRAGLGGSSLYGPGEWGGRDGFADRADRSARGRPAEGPHDLPTGEGGYGGPTGIGGMGVAGPWGPGAGRGGRAAITRRGGWGGYGGLGPDDEAAGLGDMGGFGGLGRDDDAPIDAEREPGRAQHLATGEGGAGDWTASAAGMGLRRGPPDEGRPFPGDDRSGDDSTAWVRRGDRHDRDDRPPADRFGGEHYGDERGSGYDEGHDDRRHAPGRSYGGWIDAGSMQGRWTDEGPRADDTHGAPAPPPQPEPQRRAGPKGWQRSDARIHDDVCERLSRSELDASDVSVEVREGHVTLTGTVSDRPMKHAIESLVDGCHGVRDIDNRIKVMRMDPRPGASDAPPRPHASVPQDSPTARDEARGRFSRPLPGGAGKNG